MSHTQALHIVLLVAFVLVALGLMFGYLLTQQNILKAVRRENRLMKPGQVWLQLIPLFGLFYQFFVVRSIADSIAAEMRTDHLFSFENDHLSTNRTKIIGRPTYAMGLALSICSAITLLPVVDKLTSIVAVVLWLVYWVQLHKWKKMLEARMGVQ